MRRWENTLGKADLGECFVRDKAQEIRLILATICRDEQRPRFVLQLPLQLGVVPSRDCINSELHRSVNEAAEFDLAVAVHVRVRRQALGGGEGRGSSRE